ncbi:MAG: GNAT family N-acetyltransferase [Clostridia bacterium]|nr:GNAT family N-acetyltransferase [Clostridia bacterium]
MNVPVDVSNTVLRTERLVLRPFCQADLDDLFEYASVDGVGQMAGWQPHKTKQDSQVILDKFIEHKKVFAVVKEGKVIGSLGIGPYDEQKFPEFADKKAREIGYVLSKAYWGQGLMPEAVKEAIRYCFEDLGLDLLVCGHFVRNKQSARVQEKCGFHYYSNGKYTTRMGTVEDDIVNILTREEWQKLNK